MTSEARHVTLLYGRRLASCHFFAAEMANGAIATGNATHLAPQLPGHTATNCHAGYAANPGRWYQICLSVELYLR